MFSTSLTEMKLGKMIQIQAYREAHRKAATNLCHPISREMVLFKSKEFSVKAVISV